MNKKILLVSRCAWTLYNFRTGLMRELKKQGYQVLGGGAIGDGFESRIEALGIPFFPLPVDKKGINPQADLNLLWTLYRWYRTERPAVVHHFTIKPVIYGSVAARLARVPRIVNTVTGLGYVFTEDRMARLRYLVELLYRVALASAHCTFFLNREDHNMFLCKRLVNPAKASLLPGEGIDCTLFTPSCINRTSMGALTFLMVSRLLRDKGVYEFVEAARLVKREFPKTCFQLLGRRDERNPTVVSQVDLDQWQAEGPVLWLGETADVRPHLANADVMVLPSYREGTPRSLLEAAAMAKPIIAADAVGCREVVEHRVNGLLVPVKDARGLADAMIAMIRDPDTRMRMGRAGREKVIREFDERIVIEKILKVYREWATA